MNDRGPDQIRSQALVESPAFWFLGTVGSHTDNESLEARSIVTKDREDGTFRKIKVRIV